MLHTLTVKENIVLPLTLDGARIKEMETKAEAIAETLGISHIMNKRTYEISGGQAQRAAIARAMIQDRKSTRLNSSHVAISYAVFCLKKKNKRARHALRA